MRPVPPAECWMRNWNSSALAASVASGLIVPTRLPTGVMFQSSPVEVVERLKVSVCAAVVLPLVYIEAVTGEVEAPFRLAGSRNLKPQ
jgi:hypothetical protein